MAGQAAAARLLFGMARDGGLPRALATIDRRRGVPRAALLSAGALTLVVAVWAARRDDGLDMLVSIASAVALRVRNVALADELASRRVIEHELALAHDVQMSMLPREMPQRPDVALAARLKPARSIGGDLYDYGTLSSPSVISIYVPHGSVMNAIAMPSAGTFR